MTKEEFMRECGRAFEEESEPSYMGSAKRSFSQDQKNKFLESVWEMKSVQDRVGVTEKLVKELVKRSFSNRQDEVAFILAFLA